MRRGPSVQIVALTVGALGVIAAGCSSDKAAPPTSQVTETVPVLRRADDGVLTIGVLTPQGSAFTEIGESIRKGAQLAVDDINRAGGIDGTGVKLIPEDEDVLGTNLDAAIANLIADKVDAIVGPASSANALAGLGEIVDAGVVACSPTASASLLDDFPDKNLFFRTIPSDTLQGKAIAEAVDRTGADQATIAYIDDAYGQSFLKSVSDALDDLDIAQTESFAYSTDNDSIDAAATKVASRKAGAVVVIGDATSGPVMLEAIDAKETGFPPKYVINDAMRRPTASAQAIPDALAVRVKGISPVAYSSDPAFLAALGSTPDKPSPYAANAYDCVNLIALAARSARSTQPVDIAGEIPAVSSSGSPCMTFAECQHDLDTVTNINYDGPDGSLTLDAKGDVINPRFEVFKFEDGRDVKDSTIP